MKLIFVFSCIAMTFQSITQQWIQTDLPLLGRYDDVHFINDSVGFIAQENTIFKSTNQGMNWKLIGMSDKIEYVRSIEFLDDSLGFVGTLSIQGKNGGLFRTRDGGKNFEELISLGEFEGICGLSHFNNTIIGVGTFAGNSKIYISRDKGENFEVKSLGDFIDGAVDVHMVSEEHIFISGQGLDFKPAILESKDGGLTWNTSLHFNSIGSGYIWKMFFNLEGTIMASTEIFSDVQNDTDNRIFISNDLGKTWTSYAVGTGNPNFGGIAKTINNKAWVFDQHFPIGFESNDGGVTWSSLSNQALPNINRMVTFSNGNVLAVGYGAYYYGSNASANKDKHAEAIKPYEFSMTISPNPVSQIMEIVIHADKTTFGVVEIFNQSMHQVYRGQRSTFAQGNTLLNMDIANFAAGQYFIVWKNSHKFVYQKFIKV